MYMCMWGDTTNLTLHFTDETNVCNRCAHAWLLSDKPRQIECLTGSGVKKATGCPDGCMLAIIKISSPSGKNARDFMAV